MKREGGEPAAGGQSALCTNRGGVRVSLSFPGWLPQRPRPRPPSSPLPPSLPPPPTPTPTQSPLSLCPRLSVSLTQRWLLLLEKGDNRSHTLAPATASEVPASPGGWYLSSKPPRGDAGVEGGSFGVWDSLVFQD